MAQVEDEFFVCLLSNGSMHKYPNNTQSAFTNTLPRPILLNENYVVGVSEIFLNPYNTKNSKVSHQNLTDEVTYNIPPSRQPRETVKEKYCMCKAHTREKMEESSEESSDEPLPQRKRKTRTKHLRKKKRNEKPLQPIMNINI